MVYQKKTCIFLAYSLVFITFLIFKSKQTLLNHCSFPPKRPFVSAENKIPNSWIVAVLVERVLKRLIWKISHFPALMLCSGRFYCDTQGARCTAPITVKNVVQISVNHDKKNWALSVCQPVWNMDFISSLLAKQHWRLENQNDVSHSIFSLPLPTTFYQDYKYLIDTKD